MMGIATTTTFAPFWNFVAVTITRTTPVVNAPMPLMIALRFHPGPFTRNHRRTMPVCDSVNAVNTPTTYSWIRRVSCAS